MERYDPRTIEPRWQQRWESERAFETPNPADPATDGTPSSYVLEMLPYPSGELHMGHVKNYTMGDVLCHQRRRAGLAVLHPMGYDAFGLPAENAAIREGGHPREVTERNIAAIRRQMKRMGWSIDWSRELSTHEPEYYRWTQWIFLQLFERGLAYKKDSPVKWCPVDQTVLANEQVIDGHCERCGSLVEARTLEQWYFRITAYADRLLDDMALLEDWPERVLTMQRNWIGRSQGAQVRFHQPELEVDLPVFTTRPDTLYGATFFVLAPEHPLVPQLVAGTEREQRGARLRAPHRRLLRGGARAGQGQDRRRHRAHRRQPGDRRAHPGLGRRLRADGLRHRRDHGRARARRARLGVRAGARAAGAPGRRAARRRGVERAAPTPSTGPDEVLVNSGPHTGLSCERGEAGDRRRARASRRRRGPHRLPAARLADLAPALLGLPDPDRDLRRLRSRARARGPAAGRAAGHRGLPPEGALAARRRRGLGADDVPEVRRPGAARDRHDGHVRRLVLVLPALRRPAQRHGGVRARARRLLAARCASTSAASSTRSCTCCTRASSRRCCTTPGWSGSSSRSRASSRRG